MRGYQILKLVLKDDDNEPIRLINRYVRVCAVLLWYCCSDEHFTCLISHSSHCKVIIPYLDI